MTSRGDGKKGGHFGTAGFLFSRLWKLKQASQWPYPEFHLTVTCNCEVELEAISVLVRIVRVSAAAVTDSITEVVKRWAEAFHDQGADLLGCLLAEDCVWHRPGGKAVGVEATKKVMRNLFETSAG